MNQPGPDRACWLRGGWRVFAVCRGLTRRRARPAADASSGAEREDASAASATTADFRFPRYPDNYKYVVTRADQTKYNFDKDFVLLSIADTNGVSTSFTYQGGRIQTVADDTGHLIVYQYDGIGKLASIVDRHNGTDTTPVRYVHASSQLSQAIDRFGHTTSFTCDTTAC